MLLSQHFNYFHVIFFDKSKIDPDVTIISKIIIESYRYSVQKSYGSDTNDLVLSAISNLLRYNIMLLKEGPEEFFLECGDNSIAP